jgi:hypothetical protein
MIQNETTNINNAGILTPTSTVSSNSSINSLNQQNGTSEQYNDPYQTQTAFNTNSFPQQQIIEQAPSSQYTATTNGSAEYYPQYDSWPRYMGFSGLSKYP